jgi:hypothetical protein
MGNIVIGVVVEGADAAVGALAPLGNSIRNASNTARDALGGFNQLGNTITDAGTKASTAGSKFSSFASGLKNQAGAIASVVGSGFLLFNMYDQVTDAQLRADKASTALARSNLQVERAQSALAAAIAKFGAGSQQAATAQDALNVALSRQKNAAESARDAQQGLGQAMGAFATNVVPAITTAVGSVVQVLSNVKNINLSSTFSNIGSAASGAIGGLKAFAEALGGILLRNPALIAAIVAISAAFILLKTNAFGVTDSLNKLGESLGKQAPALRPVLDFLHQLGVTLGITGSQAQKTGDAMGAVGDGAAGSAPGVNTLSDAISQMGKEQITAKVEAQALWSSIQQGAAAGSLSLRNLDVSSLEEKLPKGAQASKAAIEQVQQAVNAYNQEFAKTHSVVAANQAAQAAFNQTLQGTSQATGSADEGLARYLSTLSHGKEVAVGAFGAIAAPKTLSDLHLLNNGLGEVSNTLSGLPAGKNISVDVKGEEEAQRKFTELTNAVNGLPASKTIGIDIKTPEGLAEITGKIHDFGVQAKALPATAGTRVTIDVPTEPKKQLDPIQQGLNDLVTAINKLPKSVTLPKFDLPKLPTADEVNKWIAGIKLPNIKIPKVELPPIPSLGDIARWGQSVLDAINNWFKGQTASGSSSIPSGLNFIKVPNNAGAGSPAATSPQQVKVTYVPDLTQIGSANASLAAMRPTIAVVFMPDFSGVGGAIASLAAMRPQVTVVFAPDFSGIGGAVASLAAMRPTVSVAFAPDFSSVAGAIASLAAMRPIVNVIFTPDFSGIGGAIASLAAIRPTVTVVFAPDFASIGGAIASLAAMRPTVNVFFAPDFASVGGAIASLAAMRPTVTVTFAPDFASIGGAIASLAAMRPTVTVVFTADFTAVGSAVASIAAIRPIVTILVTADTSQASSALNALASIRIPPSEVVVFADTSEAVSAINQVEASLHALPRIVNVQLTVGGAGGVFMISQLVANIASSKISAFVASIKPVAHSSLVEAGGKLWNPFELASLLNSARGGTYVTNQSGANMVSANTNANSNNNHYLSAAKGGSFIVDQPTRMGNLLVGEGYKPELITYIPLPGVNPDAAGMLIVTPLTGKNNTKGMASGGTAMIGNSNILSGLLGGNADGGNGGSNENNTKFDKLISLLEKLVALQAHGGGVPIEATLKVDGMKMASVAQKYIGSKSYGDL